MRKSRLRPRQCRNTLMPVDLTERIKKDILDLVPDSPKERYLVSEVFSKFVSDETDPPETRKQRAINKWLATERDNEATNDRLVTTSGDFNILPRVSFARFVEFWQSVIVTIIGDTPPFEALIGSFSGGASTSRNRTSSHPAGKFVGKAHITSSLMPFVDQIAEECPGWGIKDNLEFEVVPGNVLFTVPKKTDIDRCACKEPDFNMFIQKGLGAYIREQLRIHGIDLNDQSRNQQLAQDGSTHGHLATLDLSSASDSVSLGLVELVLPICWFSHLMMARSEYTLLPSGELHRNEMFSSMGNGFTFELESLLFYSLARTVAYFTGTRGVISVYGDDIIVPVDLYDDLEWCLSYFGFSVNPEKSFKEGPFRESCGGHYHDGFDITPFYVKGPIRRLTDLIHFLNSVRKWSEIRGLSILENFLADIWRKYSAFVPRQFWGGRDTSFKFQLVSPDQPSARLHENGRKFETGLGGYLFWLSATWRRKNPGSIETSRRSSGSGYFRILRARPNPFAAPPPEFLFESSGDVP